MEVDTNMDTEVQKDVDTADTDLENLINTRDTIVSSYLDISLVEDPIISKGSVKMEGLFAVDTNSHTVSLKEEEGLIARKDQFAKEVTKEDVAREKLFAVD